MLVITEIRHVVASLVGARVDVVASLVGARLAYVRKSYCVILPLE